MPVKRVALHGARHISQRHETLKQRLVDEWGERPGVDPHPDIIEEIEGGRTVHLYVVWDEWADMSQEERSEVIMDAYEEYVGLDRALEVTVAMGVTCAEAKKMGLSAQGEAPRP